MIKSIYLRALNNAEYLQFIRFYIQLLEKNDPAALKIKPKLIALQARFNEAEAIYKLPLGNDLTGELLEFDLMRDNALMGIKALVEAYFFHYDAAFVAAANHLSKNIDLYGQRIAKMNYQEETTIIESLVRDWTTVPKLISAVKKLGLEDWMDNLENNNRKFMDAYTKRTEEYGSESTENLRAKRIEVNAAYNDLNDHLDAYMIIEKTDNLQKAINELNALIEQYNTLLKSRRPEKEEDEGETPTEQ